MFAGIIYKITCMETELVYVGLTTTSLEKRWRQHLKNSNKKNGALYLAMREYRPRNFFVEQIDYANNLDELNKREIYWIEELNSIHPNGYNMTLGGNSVEAWRESIKCWYPSKEFSQKMSHVERHKPPNQNPNKSSRHKGVSWDKKYKKWDAYIKHNKIRIKLGYFDLESDAALAYNEAVIKYWNGDGYFNEVA